jgi:hypothetical protein
MARCIVCEGHIFVGAPRIELGDAGPAHPDCVAIVLDEFFDSRNQHRTVATVWEQIRLAVLRARGETDRGPQ